MAQIRLSMAGGKAEIERVHQFLESEFEEDGYPLAFSEINEDEDRFETALYVDEDEVEAALTRIRARVGSDAFGLAIERQTMPDIDWVAHSLEGLKPVRVGRVVVHGRHDRESVSPHEIGIEIEAAQAFGTGHHGTTAGCIDMIQRILKARRPKRVLDLGTGSAVLALAYARLTQCRVLATDIDPLAVRIARENAKLNGASALVELVAAPGFDARAIRQSAPYDLVIANILAGPLMTLAPKMRANTLPGGDVILSGILNRQAARVEAAYVANGFALAARTSREGWSTLLLRRR